MTQADFVVELAAELRLRGVPYLFPELTVYLSDCWPLIAEDPSPARWASQFAESLLTADQ